MYTTYVMMIFNSIIQDLKGLRLYILLTWWWYSTQSHHKNAFQSNKRPSHESQCTAPQEKAPRKMKRKKLVSGQGDAICSRKKMWIWEVKRDKQEYLLFVCLPPFEKFIRKVHCLQSIQKNLRIGIWKQVLNVPSKAPCCIMKFNKGFQMFSLNLGTFWQISIWNVNYTWKSMQNLRQNGWKTSKNFVIQV